MSERLDTPTSGHDGGEEEEFTPMATMVLTVVYIVIFAAAWGFVYFGDLLARR